MPAVSDSEKVPLSRRELYAYMIGFDVGADRGRARGQAAAYKDTIRLILELKFGDAGRLSAVEAQFIRDPRILIRVFDSIEAAAGVDDVRRALLSARAESFSRTEETAVAALRRQVLLFTPVEVTRAEEGEAAGEPTGEALGWVDGLHRAIALALQLKFAEAGRPLALEVQTVDRPVWLRRVFDYIEIAAGADDVRRFLSA